MFDFDYPIIDLHVHLRDEPDYHLKVLKECGISEVLAMANTSQVLDSVEKIIAYKKKCELEEIKVNLVSALTRGLLGKELVNIRQMKPHVTGFSDDGKCLKNLDLLKKVFGVGAKVFAHLEPEIEYLEKYIFTLKKVGKGYLHCQHLSKAESVKLVRKAKKSGLNISAEVCWHHLYLNNREEGLAVNPPLGDENDRTALLEGLVDGTIDCIVSDYAPLPRKTGFAGPRMYVPLAMGLVENNILTERQLKERININPRRILDL